MTQLSDHADSRSDAYRQAGVDITAGYRAVELMGQHIARTDIAGVVGGLGGFGGLFDLTKARPLASGGSASQHQGRHKSHTHAAAVDAQSLWGSVEHPILVSGTDGVGTKLKIATILDRHTTVGIDCVAMCVNDVVCSGATPLFFLDYIACGRNVPEKIEQIVAGVAEGCVQAGCALIGGETAEMPGFYPENEYDLAGFTVGMVDKPALVRHTRMKSGDIVLALPSSGIHSNGFSLVRRIFDIGGEHQWDLRAPREDLQGRALGDVLLEPTRIYVKPVLRMLAAVGVKKVPGIAHITGGGFYENVPRIVPGGVKIVINKDSLRIPPIFSVISHYGNVSERDMFNTFNMGVGMVVVVRAKRADAALSALHDSGLDAYAIGEVRSADHDEPKVELV
ncbi:MAG: phosphoribosylformylglycinamidine cyclo-ligase [Actinomycetaceae bacterium]|nr:phosphoribosylformylglycinamidine cyclo-ligase [Actinomycetaceae bacterium]MDY6083354.1 phosphoribosylformylglycinamidine cyclo-ligase [Actinomycetaceae bacterium]